MNGSDESQRDAAQKHATFLRSVLALDSSDPNLPRFVPPASEPATETPEPTEPTDVTTRTRRLISRLRPPRP